MANIDTEEKCRAFYVELAKESYGLQGKDLMACVEEQVKAFREARIQQMAQQREERAEARAAEERTRIQALEAQEWAEAREAQERAEARAAEERTRIQALEAQERAEARAAEERAEARAAEERERARAHELEMARLQIQRGEGQEVVRPPPVEGADIRRPVQVTMPLYDSKTERIDDYIEQFQRLAHNQKLP